VARTSLAVLLVKTLQNRWVIIHFNSEAQEAFCSLLQLHLHINSRIKLLPVVPVFALVFGIVQLGIHFQFTSLVTSKALVQLSLQCSIPIILYTHARLLYNAANANSQQSMECWPLESIRPSLATHFPTLISFFISLVCALHPWRLSLLPLQPSQMVLRQSLPRGSGKG
jgi:hypothetical protein